MESIHQVLETICRVCGFDEDDERYTDGGLPEYVICHCCGAESGVDDSTLPEVRRYRDSWVKAGCPWFAPHLRPNGWSFETQLSAVPGRWI